MDRNNEKGTILVYILIAIALFAALSYAVAQMTRGGGDIGSEKAGVYADGIIDYARQMKDAVQKLRITNLCGIEDLSFENSYISGYEHSPVASDECKIFHSDGAGLLFDHTPAEGREWHITHYFRLNDIGTSSGASGNEITLMLQDISAPVCEGINRKTSGNESITDVALGGGFLGHRYDGDFSSVGGVGRDFHNSQPLGCFRNQVTGEYIFFMVLVVR